MQERTNFIQDEVMTLEEIGFFIFYKSNSHSRNLFGEDAFNFVNRSVDENSWPKTRNGKNICHPSIFKISTQQYNKWEAEHVCLAQILPPTNVLL